MLMALLYCDDDRIAAAAPACDQMGHGDAYWTDIHAGEIERGNMFETAYITINNALVRERLLKIGFDDSIDGSLMAKEIIASLIPEYLPEARVRKAA